MGRYILRRILINIPVLILITILVFVLIEIAPGDMVDYFMSDEALTYMSEADVQALRERLGYGDPAPIRYLKWVGRIAQGDFGFSYIQGFPVSQLLMMRIKNSLILMGAGMFFALAFGIPLGILTALRQYSITDFTLTGLSFIGISMPAFVSGILGLYLFAIKLKWVPAGGMRTPGVNEVGDLLHHLILPAAILGILHGARFMRYQRFSMLEVLGQDYITTAKAKGMKRLIVINRHALRNALIPVITVVGLTFAQFITGAIFIETIFSWPGMGTLYYRAVISRDFPIIMAANLVIAVTVLAANLITDLAYGVVDPRVRYE
jgi:peptide/nickel transport system permease protein